MNPPVNTGDARVTSLILGLGRSSGEGNGNPLQHSYLEKSMDRGAWHAITKNSFIFILYILKVLAAARKPESTQPLLLFHSPSEVRLKVSHLEPAVPISQ